MSDLRILYSLHRPYNKPLVSVKWVCMFVRDIEKKKKKITPSSFYSDFFFYLIKVLNKNYVSSDIEIDIEGVPEPHTIEKIIEFFSNISINKQVLVLKDILSVRKTQLDRNIYSTYKAASYYINLAKDKLELISSKYQLNDYARLLISGKSSFFFLSNKQEEILFERILHSDFHMFVPLCLSNKSIKKNKWTITNIHLDFVESVYGVNHFKYTKSSFEKNYDNVRIGWLESLDVLDKNKNIRKRYMDVINNDNYYKNEFEIIKEKFGLYERENLVLKNKELNLFKRFEDSYNDNIKKGIHDQYFVNLHDIKKDFRISFVNFEKLVNEFYENERKNRLILFNNTVTNIDKRKRFYVRNKPVIKINILPK